MRYLALATDYDGTLALHGRVYESTLRSLEKVLTTNRKLLLVTGRELDDLLNVFPHPYLFDWIVAENGLLLYNPSSKETITLADIPSEDFIMQLRSRGIPISVGRNIVSTVRPHETVVLEGVRDLGLDIQLIFNKEAVMMLPAGFSKATGLEKALHKMGLSPHNVAGIGDAENDLPFLGMVECSAAVGNALPAIKERADIVTEGEQGDGVVEFIRHLLADDLQSIDPSLHRHYVVLGSTETEQEVRISPYGPNLLLAGSSGSGKSTLSTGIIERLTDKRYQCCIIDPEGDYETLEQAVILGDMNHTPTSKEVINILENPDTNLVINLVGLAIQERPSFFKNIFTDLQDFRARTGRPHWIVLDETHHLMPAELDTPFSSPSPHSLLMITVHPDQMAADALAAIACVVVIGKSPGERLEAFTNSVGDSLPSFEDHHIQPGEAIFWERYGGALPVRFRIHPNRSERRRHRRKYAEGELGPDRSFYFQGPEGKLNLRAQNLMVFLQLAEGLDPETWMYHLKRHDYSSWARDCIKDKTLASEIREIESNEPLEHGHSLARIKAAIASRYVLSPHPPSPSPLPSP
ncbi:MAG: HAD hydrolase family protein [Nitrospiraceae bacterium]|nr:HAD hydrolase family protein [Nitrospiraceae bacterium]